MKITLTLCTALITSVLHAQSPIPKKGTGLLAPTEQQLRATPFSLSAPGRHQTFSSFVDISSEMPPVGDQGYQGSCVGWSVAYAFKSQQEKLKHNWSIKLPNGRVNKERVYSPSFVFNFVKQHYQHSTDCENGMAYQDAFFILQNFGVATLSAFPYDTSISGCQTPNPKMPGTLNNAGNYKFSTYSGVPLVEIEFKKYLSQHIPVMIGISLDKSFDDEGWEAGKNGTKFIWRPALGAASTGRHAVVCVGYDDQKQELKILNSWGTDWGSKGYFYVPYEVFFNRSTDNRVLNEAFVAYDQGVIPANVLGASKIDNYGLVSATGQEFNNWVKKGYYVDYNGLRLGLAYLDKDTGKAVVTFSDPSNKNKVIQSLVFNVGDTKLFFFKNYKVTFTLNEILPAGRDRIFKPYAAYYNVRFDNVTNEPLINQIN